VKDLLYNRIINY